MSRKALTLFLALALGVLVTTGAFAAIGIYKWPKAEQNCPANITYLLNTDANDTSGPWAVKVEICPVQPDGVTLDPAVRTYTYPAGDPMASRGLHTVVWDGYLADGTTKATYGVYRAVIAAKAAPVAPGAIVPLWEINNNGGSSWLDAAVNTDPTSDYYGYVYAVSFGTTKNVFVWRPDGAPDPDINGGNPAFVARSSDNWASSSPWGVDVSDDGKVYATNYSKIYVARFTPDGATREGEWNCGSNPRFFTTSGTGANFRMFGTGFGNFPTTFARIMIGSGDPLGTFTLLKDVAPDYLDKWELGEPKYTSDGNVITPAYSDPNVVTGGALVEYDPNGIKIAQNSNIRRGTGVAISPDGGYVYVARFVSGTGNFSDPDTTAVYKIPTDKAFTTADPDANVDVTKLAFNTSSSYKRAYTIDSDGFGNLVAAAGNSSAITAWNPERVGLYAPPDNGSTDTQTTADIHWSGDHQPVFISSTGATVSMCETGSTGTVTVQASDMEGCSDVKCFLDLSQFGLAAATPMNQTSCSGGTTATFQLAVSVPSTTKVGDYSIPVLVRDVHYPTVQQSVGSVDITVTGGWISGQVTVDVAGFPVAGATVTATDGANTFTGTSDADGTYIISVNPGTYTVSASNGTGYDTVSDATAVTVDCGATATANRKLSAVIVRTATGGNYSGSYGRTPGDPVCVRAYVLRAPAIAATGQKGFNGYYYLYDTAYSGTFQGVKIMNWTGTPAQVDLHEGDEVIVQGIWSFVSGNRQGFVVPSSAPYKVGPTNKIPSPTQLYVLDSNAQSPYPHMMNYSYGRYYKTSGTCMSQGTDRFTMQIATSAANPTPSSEYITVVADDMTSTGVTLPQVGDQVDITGILADVGTAFSANVIAVAKPEDVHVVKTVATLGEALAQPDGGVTVDITASDPAAAPLVVTHSQSVGGGLSQEWFYVESQDRSAGIKVNSSGITMPDVIWPGDTVSKLKGVLQPQAAIEGADREFLLLEPPVFTTMYDMSLVPKPIFMSNLALGGGVPGGPYSVADRSQGLSNQGLLVTISGRVLDIVNIKDDLGNVIQVMVYIDDGSGVASASGGTTALTGVKCYGGTAFSAYYSNPELQIGDYVTVTGIAGSQNQGSFGRVRTLRMRYIFDPSFFRFPTPFFDVFNIVAGP